jgi:dTDP-glucose 4,6-dehydratase
LIREVLVVGVLNQRYQSPIGILAHILDKFNNAKIVNIDKGGIGSRSLKEEIPRTNWDTWQYLEILGDIRNIDQLMWNRLDCDVDYIFHFAAESHVDRSISGPSPFIENNVMGMVSLLEWVRQHQPQARVINIPRMSIWSSGKV